MKEETVTHIEKIPVWIRHIYEIVAELEKEFPGRRFTPDGHLVGSIGGVLAAHDYDLELLPASTSDHDARDRKGRLIQIKATQKTGIALRTKPDFLIVLKIDRSGRHQEVYNGPGDSPWENAGKRQSNGQRPISISKLKVIATSVSDSVRIEKKAVRDSDTT